MGQAERNAILCVLARVSSCVPESLQVGEGKSDTDVHHRAVGTRQLALRCQHQWKHRVCCIGYPACARRARAEDRKNAKEAGQAMERVQCLGKDELLTAFRMRCNANDIIGGSVDTTFLVAVPSGNNFHVRPPSRFRLRKA